MAFEELSAVAGLFVRLTVTSSDVSLTSKKIIADNGRSVK